MLEDRIHLTANLWVTDVFLRDGDGNRIEAPVVGEMISVQVDYRTRDLPSSAEYRIEFSVDDVPLTSEPITLGAGRSSGSWYWYWSGWYAGPGLHNVSVTLDPDGQVEESDVSDNTAGFTFTPRPPFDLPQKFVAPLGGTPYEDWSIVNYVDVDPTSGARDYRGGEYAYHGHDAIDFILPNFAAMDRGVPIYAAASGTVAATQDGEYDRCTTESPCDVDRSNYVWINHGNGWQTRYNHMRTDSVVVTTGESVEAGQFIGFVGSSGHSSDAHLHFAVYRNGAPVETMFAPDAYWHAPWPYAGEVTGVKDSGFTNFSPPIQHLRERPVDRRVFDQSSGQTVWYWVNMHGIEDRDHMTFSWYRPDGSLYTTRYAMPDRPYRYGWWRNSVQIPDLPDLGTWQVVFRNNGVELSRDTFDVAVHGKPAMALVQDTTYILNGRTTPIDLGFANTGETAELTFSVINLGQRPLILGDVSLPEGFRVVDAPPASVAALDSAEFTIALDTSQGGSYAGEVRLASNDPLAPLYQFAVKGVVRSSSLHVLNLGIAERRITDTSSTVGSVRRSGGTWSPLVVHLTTSHSSLINVPATVTIPSGQTTALFPIQGIAGQTEADWQTVTIIGEAASYDSARNTLDVAVTNTFNVGTPLGGDALDIDGNGAITFADAAILFLGVLGQSSPIAGFLGNDATRTSQGIMELLNNSNLDIDGNGRLDFADAAIYLLGTLGQTNVIPSFLGGDATRTAAQIVEILQGTPPSSAATEMRGQESAAESEDSLPGAAIPTAVPAVVFAKASRASSEALCDGTASNAAPIAALTTTLSVDLLRPTKDPGDDTCFQTRLQAVETVIPTTFTATEAEGDAGDPKLEITKGIAEFRDSVADESIDNLFASEQLWDVLAGFGGIPNLCALKSEN